MLIILTSICAIVPVLASQSERDYSTAQPGVRFAPLHIYLETCNLLAAYQFELKATAGQIKIVGVEGGDHEAFKEAPYYDKTALLNKERIIIAAFSTSRDLPTGRTRIATVHLQIAGDVEPQYELELNVAADGNGKEIPAEITFEKGEIE
jgi:hypothetical protein